MKAKKDGLEGYPIMVDFIAPDWMRSSEVMQLEIVPRLLCAPMFLRLRSPIPPLRSCKHSFHGLHILMSFL